MTDSNAQTAVVIPHQTQRRGRSRFQILNIYKSGLKPKFLCYPAQSGSFLQHSQHLQTDPEIFSDL